MRKLKFICVQPDDQYYLWQVHAWIENLRELGHSDKATILVFTPNFRDRNEKWDELAALYPEAEFKFYKDVDGVSEFLKVYIPVLRPYCLMKYFKENPSATADAIFYCDCDIQFTEKFDISHLLDDEINYLSDTNSYINASYFDSKIKDVLPEKLEEYKKMDVLAQITSLIGISREVAEKNNNHSGGAQYLLKNVDGYFWNKVLNDCIIIRSYLMKINKEFFASEDKGFQSWCADMWAVLWNLWLREQETKVVPELDFAWAPDPISKLEKCTIYHNAGISNDYQDGTPVFYKGKYHLGANPFNDPHMEFVYNNEKSKEKCSHFYVTKLLNLKQKYNFNY